MQVASTPTTNSYICTSSLLILGDMSDQKKKQRKGGGNKARCAETSESR